MLWLSPEEQQACRHTCEYFRELIKPARVNFLQFGVENGNVGYCELGFVCGHRSENACLRAARLGHLDVLVWAKSRSFIFDSETSAMAAAGGHLSVLKWLREQNCPWCETTCSGAVISGHLEVLKWVIAEGCPWFKYACNYAAYLGYLDILTWSVTNGCNWDFKNSNYYPQHIQDYINKLWLDDNPT